MVCFGAKFVGIVLDDVWVANMSDHNKKWVRIEPQTYTPTSRFTHAICMDTEGSMFLQGGVNQNYETIGGT